MEPAVQRVILLLVAGLTLTGARELFFMLNLRTGMVSTMPAGLTWHSRLTPTYSRCTCDRQGVLKLTFSSQRRRAMINMTFEESVGFTFNVGDSVTNDGFSGDMRTQTNDAEVHSSGKTLYFFGRDKPDGRSYGLLHREDNFVANHPFNTIILNVADELATVDNGQKFIYLNSHKLFALNGQRDWSRGGVNYDLYLGMNRVVYLANKRGHGLCNVRIKFYPS